MFTRDQFVPTQWNTSDEKVKFAHQFVSFVGSDFHFSKFPKWFYKRLSNTFGHIAHYNQLGFYETFFLSLEDKIRFLHQIARWKCYGDPRFTYSDVERVLASWVIDNEILGKYQTKLLEEQEKRERDEYVRLKAKFE